MKINWGTGIVIAFVLFIGFILFFVIRTFTLPEYQHDLVDDEYYKTELKYQEEIDKQNNLKNLDEEITFVKVDNGFEINFPSIFFADNTKGTVSFYRPSNKVLDFQTPIEITEGKMLIPNEKLVEGNWNVVIDFVSESKEYLYKNSFTY